MQLSGLADGKAKAAKESSRVLKIKWHARNEEDTLLAGDIKRSIYCVF